MRAVIAQFGRGLGKLVPGTGGQTVVAAIDAVAQQRAQFRVHRALVFDGQIGNAAPRIQLEWRRKRARRTGIQTGPAGSAMIAFGRVLWQVQRGKDGAQKEPAAQFARQKVGVLALPAKARRLRQRLFHDRGGIDKDLDFAAGQPDAFAWFRRCDYDASSTVPCKRWR